MVFMFVLFRLVQYTRCLYCVQIALAEPMVGIVTTISIPDDHFTAGLCEECQKMFEAVFLDH